MSDEVFSPHHEPPTPAEIAAHGRARRTVMLQHRVVEIACYATLPVCLLAELLRGEPFAAGLLLAAVLSLLAIRASRRTEPSELHHVAMVLVTFLVSLCFAGSLGLSAVSCGLVVGSVALLCCNGLLWSVRHDRRGFSTDVSPVTGEACERALAACSADPACDAYRQKVVALGRPLTMHEAHGMAAWLEGAASREVDRRHGVACAMLKTPEPLCGAPLGSAG